MTPTPDITSQEALSPVGEGSAVGHTPGPLHVSYPFGAAIVRDEADRSLADCSLADGPESDEERFANATLYAAAPEMLEALKAAEEFIESVDPSSYTLADVRAAIARAEDL